MPTDNTSDPNRELQRTTPRSKSAIRTIRSIHITPEPRFLNPLCPAVRCSYTHRRNQRSEAKCDIHLQGGLIEGTYDLANARTAGFTVLVFAHLFNAFNARSDTVSAFTHLFVNPWLWGAVALSILLQVAVVNLGVLNLAFGTVPLAFDQWLVCIAMASVVLPFSELRKLVSRARNRRVDN